MSESDDAKDACPLSLDSNVRPGIKNKEASSATLAETDDCSEISFPLTTDNSSDDGSLQVERSSSPNHVVAQDPLKGGVSVKSKYSARCHVHAASTMSSSAFVEEINSLQAECKFVEIYEKTTKALEEKADDPDVLWLLARACWDMHEATKDVEEQKSYLRAGIEHAKKCRELSPDSALGYKWEGICFGGLSSLLPTKEKIESGFVIKEKLDAADKIAPGDRTVIMALGRWCSSVAALSWFERKAASIFFATPPESSFGEAIVYYERAKEISADPRLCELLGDCYLNNGDNAKAKACFAQALELPVANPMDEASQEEAKKKLGKC